MKTDLIILAGGKGTRLASVVNDRPKALAEINDTPFLDILLKYLNATAKFERRILSTGYKGEMILEHYQKEVGAGQILISHETKTLGTGGAVKLALSKCESEYVLLSNGDTFVDFDYIELQALLKPKDSLGALVAREVEDCSSYGLVEIDQNSKISNYVEKPPGHGRGYIYCGICLLKTETLREFCDQIENESFSLEIEILMRFVKGGLYASISNGEFIDIGTPDRFKAARSILASIK